MWPDKELQSIINGSVGTEKCNKDGKWAEPIPKYGRFTEGFAPVERKKPQNVTSKNEDLGVNEVPFS